MTRSFLKDKYRRSEWILMRGKVLIAAQEPEFATRVSLTRMTLSKQYDVQILRPTLTAKFSPRVISAGLRYGTYAIQELFSSSDILHLVNSPDFIHLPALIKGGKVVYDYRSNYSDKLRMSYPSIAGLGARVEEMLAKRANLVLTVNNILELRFSKRIGKKVQVVPNYPSKAFRAKRTAEAVRASFNFSGEGLVLFVGNLTDTYDFDLIISSARMLPGMEFWIAGSGKMEMRLRSQSPKNVKFLGKVPHDDVPDLIGAADVCVAPVRAYQKDIVHNDQDVWKVSEYAALGKPIIATNLAPSSQYELVNGDADGFSEAVKRAVAGMVTPATPRFWEDVSEPALLSAYGQLAT